MSDDLSGDMLAPSWPNLVNINEVTDFHSGFLIFSALRSNTRSTTELRNIYICVENI